jgi:hypothetical protein
MTPVHLTLFIFSRLVSIVYEASSACHVSKIDTWNHLIGPHGISCHTSDGQLIGPWTFEHVSVPGRLKVGGGVLYVRGGVNRSMRWSHPTILANWCTTFFYDYFLWHASSRLKFLLTSSRSKFFCKVILLHMCKYTHVQFLKVSTKTSSQTAQTP